MPITAIKPSGPPLPKCRTTSIIMGEVADAIRASILTRTSKGVGSDEQPLRRYSTRPMTVSMSSEQALRLKPKGGEPAYGRGHPRRLVANGRGAKGWKITGRYYRGGYEQYKRESRRGTTNGLGATGALVDVTCSGEMLRSFRRTSATATSAEVRVVGNAALYAGHVDDARPWASPSPKDIDIGAATLQAALEAT